MSTTTQRIVSHGRKQLVYIWKIDGMACIGRRTIRSRPVTCLRMTLGMRSSLLFCNFLHRLVLAMSQSAVLRRSQVPAGVRARTAASAAAYVPKAPLKQHTSLRRRVIVRADGAPAGSQVRGNFGQR